MSMYKKLTISVEEQVYEGLHRIIGRGRISAFLNALARPHVVQDSLDKAYSEMAKNERREIEALEWSDNLITDAQNDDTET